MKAPADRPADRPKAQQGAVQRTLRNFAQMLPAMLGTLLLSSLILAWLPHTGLLSWFGRHAVLDVLLGPASAASRWGIRSRVTCWAANCSMPVSGGPR